MPTEANLNPSKNIDLTPDLEKLRQQMGVDTEKFAQALETARQEVIKQEAEKKVPQAQVQVTEETLSPEFKKSRGDALRAELLSDNSGQLRRKILEKTLEILSGNQKVDINDSSGVTSLVNEVMEIGEHPEE